MDLVNTIKRFITICTVSGCMVGLAVIGSCGGTWYVTGPREKCVALNVLGVDMDDNGFKSL